MRIRGRNLSFNYEDENQGVFLENETGLTKIQVFTRAGTNVIDLPIPSELAAGEYTVSVVTKPGSFYYNNSYTVSINVA